MIMTQFNFKKWNTLLGWFAFLVAFITYSLTVEPTVSFWDAGEYILTSSKLQVGHPPGAPLFQMLGAFFSIFATDPSQIGLMLNMMSAAASAFTILFMFWSISILLQKLVVKTASISQNKGQAILGSALVGSLAFTFTDSFWFNAVETEVYAMATLILAVLFYLALRWEQDMDKPRGNKWLILISFIIGLSFGVHFMGLLTIPAIGLIYFFKNYKTVTVKNFIIANVVVVTILLFIFKLLLPNALKFFSAAEVFFVNSIGLPFNSGSIIAGLLAIALFYYGIHYTRKKQYKHTNTLILCVLFIFIGFSSWMMLPIRANANVVINENNPSSARELLAYYNLEQYPKTHLFYGPQFTEQYAGYDENNPYVDDKPKYEKDYEKGKYVIVNDYKNASPNYNSKHASILPRMWSAEHAENYMLYTGFIDFKIKPEYQMQNEVRTLVSDFIARVNEGQVDYSDYSSFLKQYGPQYFDIEKPSFGSNIAYMLEYQLGYMYWRYFMWNFTGRQDDIQGKYDMHGNWISGINFIDEIHLGLPQDNLPSDVLNNKARNTYYFLPFLLGLIGLFFLFNTDKKLFWTMLVFFLFTGLAIQFYTNVRPFEPRERDYSVVGSFYVFAIWIGFGVYALFELLQTKIKSKLLAPTVALICLVLVPGILAANNWDDHDRSGKRTANSMARSYLESCAPNAILFTIGDNDTFPLWYLQEIEGVRTDVRVINTSLFQTDWYIDQMKRKAYESDPIPSQLTHKQYRYGTNDYVIKAPVTRDTLNIKEVLNFIASDNPRTKYKYVLQQDPEIDINRYRRQELNMNYLPTENVRIPVNKDVVLKNGIVKDKDADKIVPYIDIKIKGSALYKNRLLMLDVVANNNWERPIYFTGGAFADDDYIWMKDYLQLDGLCYKLVPIKTPVDKANPFDMGRIDSDLMYEKVKNWDWGNSGKDIYYDVETRKNGISYRGNLARLIETLINEEQFDKAEEIADLAMEKMPVDAFGYYTLLEPYIGAYYEVKAKDKARQLFFDVSKKYQETLTYHSTLNEEKQSQLIEEISTDISRYRGLIDVLMIYEDKDFVQTEMQKYNNFIRLFTGEEPEDLDRIDKDIPIDTNAIEIDSNE
jgi:Protein O-mannosyl-transferase TMEM260-like